MSEQELTLLFSENLKYYMARRNVTQAELAEALGVTQSAVSLWVIGSRAPRMNKIDAICEYLGIQRSDLLERKDKEENKTYYVNQESAKIAQEIFENKELRLLFDAAKDVDPESLKALHSLLLSMKKKEQE